MGIITEDPKVRKNPSPLSDAEFVRNAGPSEVVNRLASGRESLTLKNRCLVHRNVVAGHSLVNIVPVRNIDSFSLQAYRLRSLQALGFILAVGAILSAIWLYGMPLANRFLFGIPSQVGATNYSWLVPVLLLVGGLVVFLAYGLYRKVQLVVYTRSGSNQIKLPLSPKIGDAIEGFVAQLEAQMH